MNTNTASLIVARLHAADVIAQVRPEGIEIHHAGQTETFPVTAAGMARARDFLKPELKGTAREMHQRGEFGRFCC